MIGRIGPLGIAVILACWIAPNAEATGQQGERLDLNGRRLVLLADPLAALLEDRPELQGRFRSPHTGCHRGYVGHWRVEGDRLLLDRVEAFLPVRSRDDIDDLKTELFPLHQLVPGASSQGGVPATWVTGRLRAAFQSPARYFHRGFVRFHALEVHLHVVKGQVVAQRLVHGIDAVRGRSRSDLIRTHWHKVLPLREPSPSSSWVDLRALGKEPEGIDQVPGNRTRGLLDRDEDGQMWLWVPATPVTPKVDMRIRRMPPDAHLRGHDPVEVQVTRRRVADGWELEASTWRFLKATETIHHPGHPLRPYDPKERLEAMRVDWSQARQVTLHHGLGVVRFTRGVMRIRGPLYRWRDRAFVAGCQVAETSLPPGTWVQVEGIQDRWVLTSQALIHSLETQIHFWGMGLGRVRRLVDLETGTLAIPRPLADDALEEASPDDS